MVFVVVSVVFVCVSCVGVVSVVESVVEVSPLPDELLELLPDESDVLFSAALASSFTPKINIVPNRIEAVPTVNLRMEYLLRLFGRKSNFFIEKIPPRFLQTFVSLVQHLVSFKNC